MFRFGRISSQGPGKPATSFHHRLEDIFVDLKITPQFPRTESLQHEPGRITCLHRLCSEDGYFIFRYSRLQLDLSLDKSYIKKEKSGHHLQFEILRMPLGGHIIYIFCGKKNKKTPATKPLASFPGPAVVAIRSAVSSARQPERFVSGKPIGGGRDSNIEGQQNHPEICSR